MNNEQIDKTLNSLDGIRRAQPNPLLYQKIRQRLEMARPRERVEPALVWRLAAACLLLAAVNVLSWMHFRKVETAGAQSSVQQLYSEYFSNNSTYGY